MDRKIVNFIKEQYPPGTRIRLNAMDDPYHPILPGTEGEVDFVDDKGQIFMKWDNGRTLPLAPGEDSFTVLPPKLTTLKLYMPLTADLYERNEYGEFDDSSTLLEGRELRGYQDQIMAALAKNRMPEEAERGLMHWYDEADSVDRKVRSAVFTVEARDRQLWGVAECRVAGELLDTELETLKEYLTGQASDGWGEGFEQREISVDDGGELYVHLWNSDEWSIQTEQELFSPKLAEGLPELCFSTLPGTEGEVDFVDDAGQLHMKWDNGRSLALIPGEDRFTVLPPKLPTLKLYMPLTADLYERNEYGDFDDSSTLLEGSELRGYQDQITAALVKNRMPEETERGLMHWYDEADSVDRKVRSAVFAVEVRDRQLWGVAECRVAGELSDTELETLKEYLTGQASDGWGVPGADPCYYEQQQEMGGMTLG